MHIVFGLMFLPFFLVFEAIIIIFNIPFIIALKNSRDPALK